MFNQDCRSLVAQKCFLSLRDVLRSQFCSKEKSTSKKKSEQLRRNMPPLQFALPRGALAQLVRAPPCHGGGCGFEPRRLRGFCITKSHSLGRPRFIIGIELNGISISDSSQIGRIVTSRNASTKGSHGETELRPSVEK